VSRLIGDGARMTVAATVATNRLEQFRGAACARAGSGSSTTRGITERWTATPLGGRALEVSISVTYLLRSRGGASSASTQRFRGAVPCAP
jgi:hypothetical protein